MTPDFSDLDPALHALEEELQKLQPRDVSPRLIDEVTGMVHVTKHSDDHALEATLMQLRPCAAPVAMVTRIQSLLQGDQSDKVISMPSWRDFAPIFRVAAVIIVCLGILATWKSPPASTTMGTQSAQDSQGPALDSLQPVSADGEILERGGGVIRRDGQFHEQFLILDRKNYRDKNLEIEDEVIWQGNAARPLDAM